MIASQLFLRSIALSALAFGVGCSAAEPIEPGPEDAGVADAAPPEDAGPPAARYLVEPKGLFGDTSVNNRFLNPDFDLTAEGWLSYPTMDGATSRPVMRRLFVLDTPTRQPILVMPKAPDNMFGVGTLGTARAGAGSFDVTVWVGRPADQGDLPASVALAGVAIDEGERAWELAAVEDSRMERGGRVWTQYGARVPEGPVGFANLIVTDDSEVPLYLSGPVMVPSRIEARIRPIPLKVAGRRALNPAEARGQAAWARRLGDRLGAPPTLHPRLPRPAPQR